MIAKQVWIGIAECGIALCFARGVALLHDSDSDDHDDDGDGGDGDGDGLAATVLN